MSRAPVTVEILTPQDAEPKMAAAAGSLLARGLVPGDRVAFWLPSSADLLCAVLGAARVGIIPVLLNATLLAAERDVLLEDCQPAYVVLDRPSLVELFDGVPVALSPYPLTRPMHYTSGTTGRPKGVTTGIFDEETAAQVFLDEASVWGFGPDDLHMVCSPMYHTVAIRFSAGTLLSGGSLVILSRYDATTALRVLREVRPTTAFLVPTHLQRLLAEEDLGPDEVFDSLRLLAHAGAPCPPALKRAALKRVGDGVLYEFYGSTEGQFTVCTSAEWLERPGTVGRARPGRRLTIEPMAHEDDGETDDESGVGVIWCEAPPFAAFSYFENPEATALAWRGEAFSVGDLGWIDDDGYLFVTGRRTDLIITGGVNVYPAEVEAALLEIDGVEQVCVFGRDDSTWGQAVCAAVVADPQLDAAAILEASRGRLAPFKRPKEIFLTTSLPVGPTGKVLRREIERHLGIV